MPKLTVILLLLFVGFSTSAQERTFKVWNKNGISTDLSEKTTLSVNEKIHYSPNVGGLDMKYGDIWLEKSPNDWLHYGGGFRVAYSNKKTGWVQEQRPMLKVGVSQNLGDIELKFSNRFEYRAFEAMEDYFRHRQKLTIDFPSLSDWGMQFYAAEESYFKLNGQKTHLARVYAGIKALDYDFFSMKLYYVIEKSRAAEYWNTFDILGINLSVDL